MQTATPQAAGSLILGNGATVERQLDADKIDKTPAFGSSINLSYTTSGAVINSDVEVPASNIINNVSVTDAGGVVLTSNIQVNGTLTLADLLNATTNTKTVTMASGATLVLEANGNVVLDQNLTELGPINIIYNGAALTTTRELGPVSSGAYTSAANNITFQSGVTLQANLTVDGVLKFDGGNFTLGGFTVTSMSDITQTSNGGFFAGAGTVNLSGSTNDTLALHTSQTIAAGVAINVAKSVAKNWIALTGGNLDFATNVATLGLSKGVLRTGSNLVILAQGSSINDQPTQGFTKTDTSYVYGEVKKFLNQGNAVSISNVQYPVGTNPDSGAAYRPLTLYFSTLPSSVNLIVSYVGANPGGNNGFPITAGTNSINGYPNFYWFLSPDISISQTTTYNMEAQAQGYTGYAPSVIQNLVFIRRDSGTVANPWTLQGTSTGYVNATLSDGSPDIRVNNVAGGISINGTLFTYGQTNITVTDTVSGKVAYDKSGLALSSVTVTLTPVSGGTALTGTTNSSGAYVIPSVAPNQKYVVTASTSKAWGGVNATDALLDVRYYAGLTTFDTMEKLAADVDNSGSVNATDALLIVRRYAGLISSFTKPDWLFANGTTGMTDTINVTANTTENVSGIATGDVSSTYVPPAASQKGQANTVASLSSVKASSDQTLRIPTTGTFEVPVTVSNAMTIGAVSMRIKYPSDLVTFDGISGPMANTAITSDAGGYVTVAWFDQTGGQQPLDLKANDQLVTLKFTAQKALDKNASLSFDLAPDAAIAGADGTTLNAGIEIPTVQASIPDKFALRQNYPNPFNPSTIIEYDLPVSGHVTLSIYNVMGQKVTDLVNGNQNAGSYKLSWNATSLASGVYFYRITVDAGSQHFSQIHRMMLLK